MLHCTRDSAHGERGRNLLSVRHYARPVSPTRRNPPPIPADTSREAWLFERAMRARQTQAERLREFAAVVDVARTHQLNAIRRRVPDLTEIEVRLWCCARGTATSWSKRRGPTPRPSHRGPKLYARNHCPPGRILMDVVGALRRVVAAEDAGIDYCVVGRRAPSVSTRDRRGRTFLRRTGGRVVLRAAIAMCARASPSSRS